MIGKIRPFTLLNYTSQARNLHVLKHNGAKEGKLLFLSIWTLHQIMPSPPRVMYHQRSPKQLSDGKFMSAKQFICWFFRKSWRYMDSYRLAQLLLHENNPHCVPLYIGKVLMQPRLHLQFEFTALIAKLAHLPKIKGSWLKKLCKPKPPCLII